MCLPRVTWLLSRPPPVPAYQTSLLRPGIGVVGGALLDGVCLIVDDLAHTPLATLCRPVGGDATRPPLPLHHAKRESPHRPEVIAPPLDQIRGECPSDDRRTVSRAGGPPVSGRLSLPEGGIRTLLLP